MQTSLAYLLERVRNRANELKPVMGSQDDNDGGHWYAKMSAQRQVLIETCSTLEACGDSMIPCEVVLAVLESI